jgi:hypothetical protein
MNASKNIWLSQAQLERAAWRPSEDLLGDAGAVLDALLTGVIDSPELAPLRSAMLAVVMAASDAMARQLAPRTSRCVAWRRKPRAWWTKLGLVVERTQRGEHDYVCLFCGESLDTVSEARGAPRSIPVAKYRRWQHHAAECACQVVIEVARCRGTTP